MGKLFNYIGLIICLCCIFGIAEVSAKTLKILAHPLKPFVFKDNEQLTGLATDIVTAITQGNISAVEIKLIPFPRAIYMAQNTEDLAIFAVARTKEREHTLQWVGPLVSSNVYLYKRKDKTISANSLAEINGRYRIAVARGNADHTHMLTHAVKNIHAVNSQLHSLQMLNAGYVDLIPVSHLVLPELLEAANIPSESIERTDIKLYASDLYLAFSNNVAKATIAQWQQSLDILKKSGEYQRLYDKYISLGNGYLADKEH